MKKPIVIVVLAVVLVFGAGMAVGAAGSEPGSNGDPLITKSYLENQLANVKSNSSFEGITLSKGKKLVCSEGAQVVVIAGAAKSTGILSDLTEGSSIGSGKSVSLNHSCLITKSKTGIKATKSCKVYVIGGYSIQ